MEKNIVNEEEFNKHHEEQVDKKSQKNIFFIWLLIIVISVLAAHLVLNFAPGSPTGFVTAAQSPETNIIILFSAFLVVSVGVLITAVIHKGITRKDY